jgi:hypothetical protein
MNKYEQLIEHIINDDEAKARALFHQIVVEKSRDIYESLMDEEYAEEDIHSSNPVESMVDEITADETMQAEEEEMDMEPEMGMDDMGDDDMGDEPMGGQDDPETIIMKLEDELDKLKDIFAAQSGNDMGDEADMDMDMGDEESGDEMGDEESDEEMDDEMMEASEKDEDEDEDKDEDHEMKESRQTPRYTKTAVDLMREYVEKISAPSNTEFTPVGTGAGGDNPAGNTKNPMAGKNDMGGTTGNIVKGGSEQAPDGTSPKGKVDGKLVKNAQEIDVAKRNVNKPGGNKGAQDWYGTKASAKKGEDGGTNKTSIETGGN